jgi:hypothetical protein
LVDLSESKHTLTNDTPGLVGVGVIADDLGSNHKSRDEEAVPGGTARGDEPGLQSLQKVECSKGHGGRKSGTVEGVCDEMREVWAGLAGRRGLRLVGTVEKGVYVTRAHLCGLFMAVVVVLR